MRGGKVIISAGGGREINALYRSPHCSSRSSSDDSATRTCGTQSLPLSVDRYALPVRKRKTVSRVVRVPDAI